MSIPGYDAWKTRAPEDERGYYDDIEQPEPECEMCNDEIGDPPPLNTPICADCGYCTHHCNGHTDDELRADQGLDDDIDF